MNPAEAFPLSVQLFRLKERGKSNIFPQKPLCSAGMNNIFISSLPNSRKWKQIPSIGFLALVFSLSCWYVYSCSHIKKFLRTKIYAIADKNTFSWYLDVHLAVSGKAYPLPSHVMRGREKESAREGKSAHLFNLIRD